MIIKPILTKVNHNRGNEQCQIKNQQAIIPLNKISTDVIKKLQTQPYPQLALSTHSTITQALQLYYNQYVRLFRQNQILNDQLAGILQDRNNLADQFNQIKKMKSYDDNIRRRRRYASEIQRNYHCPMPKCNKGYGSEGSLTHHVRLKHPKFFQSGEYEIYLQTYILPKQQTKKQDKAIQLSSIPINLQSQNKKQPIQKIKQTKLQNEQNRVEVVQKQNHSNQILMRQVQGYIQLESSQVSDLVNNIGNIQNKNLSNEESKNQQNEENLKLSSIQSSSLKF